MQLITQEELEEIKADKENKTDRINAKYDAEIEALNNNNTENKSIEEFSNPDEFYRVIVGDEAFNDIVDTGIVRTNAGNKNTKIEGGINLGGRPTLFPSFSKGKASMSYAAENPNNYIIVTDDASIQPSKNGRHGKGTTMFPTGEDGKHLNSLDSNFKVYKHIGDGKYELVYTKNKAVNNEVVNNINESDNSNLTTDIQNIINNIKQVSDLTPQNLLSLLEQNNIIEKEC